MEEQETTNSPGASPQQEVIRARPASGEQEAQQTYDKVILMLSGGALGLSVVAVKDYLLLRGGAGVMLIVLAMLCWALSVSCILVSFLSTRRTFSGGVRREDSKRRTAHSQGGVDRVVSGFRIGAGALFFWGVVFFAAYVASWPPIGGRHEQSPVAGEEISRLLSLYDTIRETCPDCSAAEAHKVLQVCEGSYIVPEVLSQACPHCTEKGILQLGRRCMEKWK